MKKLRSVWVFLAIVCLFVLVACGGSKVEGTYYNVVNDTEYIELQKDGQFHLKAGTLELSGKYVIDGKIIVLNPDSKMAARGTIEKGMIIDNDGTKWKKK